MRMALIQKVIVGKAMEMPVTLPEDTSTYEQELKVKLKINKYLYRIHFLFGTFIKFRCVYLSIESSYESTDCY